MTETQQHYPLRANAVRSSATEYDAKVDPDDFDDWLKRVYDAAWNEGYAAGRPGQR
jgi:hypothetical protein